MSSGPGPGRTSSTRFRPGDRCRGLAQREGLLVRTVPRAPAQDPPRAARRPPVGRRCGGRCSAERHEVPPPARPHAGEPWGRCPAQAPPRASRPRPVGGAAGGGRARPRDGSERRGGRLGSAGDRQVDGPSRGHSTLWWARWGSLFGGRHSWRGGSPGKRGVVDTGGRSAGEVAEL